MILRLIPKKIESKPTNQPGWWLKNSIEKYDRQNRFIFPNFLGLKQKNIWNHHETTTTASHFPPKWHLCSPEISSVLPGYELHASENVRFDPLPLWRPGEFNGWRWKIWPDCWWLKSGQPVEVGSWNLPLFTTGFIHPQVVVWDFWTINSITPLKTNGWNIIPWRFGRWSCSFLFMGDL